MTQCLRMPSSTSGIVTKFFFQKKKKETKKQIKQNKIK